MSTFFINGTGCGRFMRGFYEAARSVFRSWRRRPRPRRNSAKRVTLYAYKRKCGRWRFSTAFTISGNGLFRSVRNNAFAWRLNVLFIHRRDGAKSKKRHRKEKPATAAIITGGDTLFYQLLRYCR